MECLLPSVASNGGRLFRSQVQAVTVADGDGDDSSDSDDDVRTAVLDYKYKDAPENQRSLLESSILPTHMISPNRCLMLMLEEERFKSLAHLAVPELSLAGMRINPKTNSVTRSKSYCGITVCRTTESPVSIHRISLPGDARISEPIFSPDSQYLAFLMRSHTCHDAATLSVETPILLYIVDMQSLGIKRLSNNPVCRVLGPSFTWLSDSSGVLFRTPDPDRGPIPIRPATPLGPTVLEGGFGHDVKRRAGGDRTYQDLLKDSFDCILFEYFCTSQVVQASLTGFCKLLPIKGLLRSCTPSPDSNYLLVKTIHRPFSYFILWGRFPTRITVHKLNDQCSLIRELVDLSLADSVPVSFDACRVGPRHVTWRADAVSTLVWSEAQDKGDPKVCPADGVRDCVFLLSAPFLSVPIPICCLKLRFKHVKFGSPGMAFALVTDKWIKSREQNTWRVQFRREVSPRAGLEGPAISVDDSNVIKVSLLWACKYENRYDDPGVPLTRSLLNGAHVLHAFAEDTTGHDILYVCGDGASPEGDRPFLDLLNMDTGTTMRRWQSAPPCFESILSVISRRTILIRRESPTEPPNFFLIHLDNSLLSSPSATLIHSEIRITSNQHPCPEMSNVQSRLIRYKRHDGVELSGYLYLPPGVEFDKLDSIGNRQAQMLPTLLWAYPKEFKSIEAAGQTIGSPFAFTIDGRPSLYFLLEGYAVLDRMTMPIVAEGTSGEPNDTYIEQLVANARAAINYLADTLMITDRSRVAVGGHSYGAFMTANLLAHSNLFAAGVARSGAYNRTLTPNGFQKEERTLWQAPEVYYRMSPYMAADKIKSPLLLIHGAADNNAGTYPMQSERMFAALKSHGHAPARFVCLPFESHHYKSRESCGHVLWETTRWFNRYVKNRVQTQHRRSTSQVLSMLSEPTLAKTTTTEAAQNTLADVMQTDATPKLLSDISDAIIAELRFFSL